MFKHIGLLSKKIKYHQHLIFSSYCLAAVPARWLFRASEGMLAKKNFTLASTIFILQRMEILATQGICKKASLATRLHTNYPCPFCHNNSFNQEKVVNLNLRKYFNDIKYKHPQVLILRFTFSEFTIVMCISCLCLFLETYQQLSLEHL